MFHGKEYVLTVFEEQSFSKASEKMFVSQPSLSANVKRIEKRLGHDIFDRSTIPIKLTEFGVEYIRNAKEIQRIEADFQQYISKVDNLQYGRIAIGGTSLFASMVLPKLMAKFNAIYPEIQIDLFEETSSKLIDLLHEGEIDLLLDNTFLDSRYYDHFPFVNESLLLAVPEKFEVNGLLKDYQLSLKDIKNHSSDLINLPLTYLKEFKHTPFVFLKVTNDTGSRARAICQEAHFVPNIAFEVEQQLTAYNISSSGIAISFIGEALIHYINHKDQVKYYRLESENAKRPVNFYWKKDRYQSKAVEAFLELLKKNKN
ncbi:LysR family transcriptional regulator [Facklamia miroungae]|uniref:DNA-binding transcriptional regulator, LysR family n=1 Tax=Facklamia miroungae TaxID=120956 RepID=A0A1G7T6Q4_9LACT|nr:LysR family transcriptional regulator [Facklamia miroungae]NKZ29677.1 LysR family transcriptional regulator [Facklamia miroungae]SDG30714.1 DNA-binding transcriptional regulator, LysR family [Facklamia miroungae]